MHPAPSLSESFPKASKTDERAQHIARHQEQDSSQQPQPQSAAQAASLKLDSHSTSASQSSPPMRKDTASSTSTNATDATAVTNASADTNATGFSVESSQSIFSVKDGSEISSNRRASRRRTGPLSAQQREKAALIRKLGACGDCRRRRVACHPNHHNMTWEDAVRKYRSSSPLQDLAPLAGRPISPAPKRVRTSYTQDHQEMDVDAAAPATPHAQAVPGRQSIHDSRIRTPLPSGPRLEKSISMPALPATPSPYQTMPNLDSVKADLESTASSILSSPHRNRYASVSALLITWQDDDDPSVIAAVNELAEVFEKYYHFKLEIIKIPASASDGCTNPWRWLSRIINEFTDKSDTRDVLKIVYYNGYSYLDENREMVLASSRGREKASTIRWSGIQQILEEACSDTLIIMDSAYYPSSKMVRQKGVLELIAASASEDYFSMLDRGSFTRTLADLLRTRAAQRLPNALTAAELHSKLLSIYPKIIYDRHPDKDAIMRFPSPLHMQISGNSRLPSITLSPPQLPRTLSSPEMARCPQLTFSIRMTEDALSLDSWTDWLRMMPEGIRDLKVEGPYHTFR
ncbi:hypothetical protein F5X99DRAFT_425013 [Biscogniauxia marginata]|nr:hypothetical protein F5X99DRAFT_425013 [Biscogniauxia marginata]